MSYEQVVRELESLGIMPTSLPKLTPMQRALERAELLDRIDPRKNIIVAGTNGKGSTAATLTQLLSATGLRVGLYTSPHLITTRERIRIGSEEISADISEGAFVQTYVAVKKIIQEEKLTHFEALTLMAAHFFYSNQITKSVDWTVWEVGLGGLYDATNAIPHHWCAITKLGLDHQGILGNTLREIATQKFGVIGKDAVVVYSPMEDELRSLCEEIGSRTHCRWIPAKPVRLAAIQNQKLSNKNRMTTAVETPWGKAELSLLGSRAAENTATALTLFEALGYDPSQYLQQLAHVEWPGRFSALSTSQFSCPAYVSGDHNPQGVESLLEILKTLSWKTLHLVVGIAKDKNAEEMLECFTQLPNVRLYLTETSFKPLPLESYPDKIQQRAAMMERDLSKIFSSIQESAAPDDLVLITGSLYLVGKAISLAGA